MEVNLEFVFFPNNQDAKNGNFFAKNAAKNIEIKIKTA
jgi:hypothetical protein